MEFETPFTMYGTYSDGQEFTMPVIDTEALSYFIHMQHKGMITIHRFDGEPAVKDENSLFSKTAFEYLGGFTLDVNSAYPDISGVYSTHVKGVRFALLNSLYGKFVEGQYYDTLMKRQEEIIAELGLIPIPKRKPESEPERVIEPEPETFEKPGYRISYDCDCDERHSFFFGSDGSGEWAGVWWTVKNRYEMLDNAGYGDITIHASDGKGVWTEVTDCVR